MTHAAFGTYEMTPRRTVTEWQREVSNDNIEAGWWDDIDVTDPKELAVKIALIHGGISEMLEAIRKDKVCDDHLPQYHAAHVKAADVIIRFLDLCAAMGIDLEPIMYAKMAYDRSRVDHTHAARAASRGKRF